MKKSEESKEIQEELKNVEEGELTDDEVDSVAGGVVIDIGEGCGICGGWTEDLYYGYLCENCARKLHPEDFL